MRPCEMLGTGKHRHLPESGGCLFDFSIICGHFLPESGSIGDNRVEENGIPAAAREGDLDLGVFLGRIQAFGLISGRCSAAQAIGVREIYEKKLYKQHCPDWGRFCRDYLNMARSRVQEIINLLNEFGPQYFELSQLTRVSPETYRAIRPALQDGSLHVDGEAIALISGNAARISAAVAEMRKAAKPQRTKPVPAQPSEKERLAVLRERTKEILSEFAQLLGTRRHQYEIAAMLIELQTGLDRLQLQV